MLNVNKKGNEEYGNVLNEIGWMECISLCVGDLSSSLGSACTTNRVTCEEDSELNTSIDMLHLPYPFSLLDVQPSKSSSRKCWIFHYGSPNHREFFLQNRNFVKSKFS